MKVQDAIQGDVVRVTGKKRDDLQEAIALVKGLNLDLPLKPTIPLEGPDTRDHPSGADLFPIQRRSDCRQGRPQGVHRSAAETLDG